MLEPGDKRHGTPNGYNNLGCRCDACRAAMTSYMRDRRYNYDRCACGREKARQAETCRVCFYAATVTPNQHGTDSRYCKGCRCLECREAHREARARRRERAAA